MPKLALISVGLAALAGVGLLAHTSATANGGGGTCGRKDVRVIAKKGDIAIYEIETRGGDRRNKPFKRTELCQDGRRTALDDGGNFDRVQYASVAITGDTFGYALESCEPDGPIAQPCETFVVGAAARVPDPTPGRSDVSQLRIGRTGATAWISCRHESGGPPNPRLGRACFSTRRPRSVFVIAPPLANATGRERYEPVRLDTGRGINPFSLAVGSKRVTWRRNGRLRSAPFPVVPTVDNPTP